MSISTYLIDSALVLLVVLQMKERALTNQALLRPVIILGVAVAAYFTNLPTAGNDLPLIAAIGTIGAVLGLLSGITVIMGTNDHGKVTARAGVGSAVFWVLGMGGRFAFAVWAASAAGAAALGTFSVENHITGAAAWTDALLAMAVAEVLVRSAVLLVRRSQASAPRPLVLA